MKTTTKHWTTKLKERNAKLENDRRLLFAIIDRTPNCVPGNEKEAMVVCEMKMEDESKMIIWNGNPTCAR